MPSVLGITPAAKPPAAADSAAVRLCKKALPALPVSLGRASPECCHRCCWSSPLSSSDRAGKQVGWRSSQGSAPQQLGVWLGREGKGGKTGSETQLFSHGALLTGPLKLALMSPINPTAAEHVLVLTDFCYCSRIFEIKLPGCRMRGPLGPVALVPLRKQKCVSPQSLVHIASAQDFYLFL